MRRAAALWALLFLLLAWPAGAAQAPSPAAAPAAPEPVAGQGPVWVIELADSVNPGSSEYLRQALALAQAEDAALVVIQLDTPGGLVESMREMVQAILGSSAPVAVYVAPQGARAASAGAFLVLAGHVSAMAPATNIGAAHPVAAGGSEVKGAMGDKVLEDLTAFALGLASQRGRPAEAVKAMIHESKSYAVDEALSLGLVDLMATDLASLLGQIEGHAVTTSAGPRRITSHGRTIRFERPGPRARLLSTLANPNLAYILLMIGLAGLYFELSHPGAIFPGVVGGISLLLAFFAMSTLPVSYAGLGLILLAVALFVAEIKVVSHGLLTLGGAAALVLGSLMLFQGEGDLGRVSLMVLLPTLLAVIGFFAGVAFLAGRAQRARAVTGSEGLVGEKAVATAPDKVMLLGELWRAQAAAPLVAGQEVVVTRVEGLTVWVEPKKEEEPGA
jgi:membrane-bound serine protease (ClpP class)